MLDTGIGCYVLYDNVIRAVADELDFFANPPGHSPTSGPARYGRTHRRIRGQPARAWASLRTRRR